MWERLKSFWQGSTPIQKILWAAIPAVIIVALILVGIMASQPSFAPLFTNLSSADAGVIVNDLKDQKIPFKIVDGGKTILVPDKNVYSARLSLATKGLPKGGGVGFEIFDKTNLGVTDFTQRINYIRALEGELTRTIANITGVEEARVHLVVPKKELYEERQNPPTASVFVKLLPEVKLQYEQIKGIVHLVSSAVEGMNALNITVVDANGNVLSDAIRDELEEAGNPAYSYSKQLKLTNQQINMQQEFERDIKRKVEVMLSKVLGENRISVSVNAELNFDQVESKDEIYEPIVAGKGVLRSSKKNYESYSGIGVYPGGVPGTDSNIPGYKSVVSGNSSYQKSEATENYEITKREKHTVATVGSVKRMSVSVMVDNLQPQQVASIRNAVIAASGVDLTRGDVVSVENLVFDKTTQLAEQRTYDMKKGSERNSFVYAMFIIIAFLFFTMIFLRSTLKPKAIREKLRHQIEMAARDVREKEEIEVPLEAVPSAVELAEAQKRAEMKRQITKIARENPKVIVQLIKRWLTEEKR